MPSPENRLAREVLIVDDEEDVREVLVEHFRARGFEVAVASDGRAAISSIERTPSRFGMIVTDLQLPGADGLAILQAARAANTSCYVVIVTGYASLDSAIQAVRLGAYDYLTKPFSLGQIDVILERIADRLALEAENRQLARRVEARESAPAVSAPLTPRLDAIESRLVRLESLVLELAANRRAVGHSTD
ncbi:MAG: response regulator [Acidobacteria bacterium]|nr:response regulator [Acidobacteriota bacterium]